MTGLPKFSTVPTRNFERWLKRLIKCYKISREKQAFIAFVSQLIDELCNEPSLPNSAPEPIPGKIGLSEGLEFRKLRFNMPGLKGASGQGRLIYLINSIESKIILVWIYTHEEFEGRPDDKSLNGSSPCQKIKTVSLGDSQPFFSRQTHGYNRGNLDVARVSVDLLSIARIARSRYSCNTYMGTYYREVTATNLTGQEFEAEKVHLYGGTSA